LRAERRNHARGYRAREAVGISDRHDQLADAEILRVAELRGGYVAVEPEHREVGEWVGTDKIEGELAPVDERRLARAVGALDHVGGREHEAVGGDHHAAAGAVEAPAAAHAAGDAEVGDRR
jgi:hypothetical protein